MEGQNVTVRSNPLPHPLTARIPPESTPWFPHFDAIGESYHAGMTFDKHLERAHVTEDPTTQKLFDKSFRLNST
jgi:hypothetical protein